MRLVTKCFAQNEGIDFHETFEPVVTFSFQVLIVGKYPADGWNAYYSDVLTAFLIGYVDGEIYVSWKSLCMVSSRLPVSCERTQRDSAKDLINRNEVL